MFGIGENIIMFHYTDRRGAEEIKRTKRFRKGTFFSPVYLRPDDARRRLFIGHPDYAEKTTVCFEVAVPKRIVRRVCNFKPLSKPKKNARNLYEIHCGKELSQGDEILAIKEVA